VELRNCVKFSGDGPSRCRDIAIFGLLKMAANGILDFKNFKFLTIGTVKKVESRHYEKCRRNRSYRGRDMAIFRFFTMAVLPSYF